MRPSPSHVERRTFKRHRRIRQLGYEDYAAYLHSPAWSDVKRRYRESDLPQMCVCGATEGLHLHHKTYARVGEEQLEDLAPLCKPCHADLHVIEARGEVSLDYNGLKDDLRAAAYALVEKERVRKSRREWHATHHSKDIRRQARTLAVNIRDEFFQADASGLDISRELDAVWAALDSMRARRLGRPAPSLREKLERKHAA